MSGAKPAVRRQAEVLSPFAGRLSTLKLRGRPRWVAEHGYANYKRAISEDHVTLAEALQREGYDPFAASTNPHVTIRNGLSLGFDRFVDTLIWQDRDASMMDAVFFESEPYGEWLVRGWSRRPVTVRPW